MDENMEKLQKKEWKKPVLVNLDGRESLGSFYGAPNTDGLPTIPYHTS